MTAYTAPATFARATGFERALLHTASRIDGFVSLRLERRAAAVEPDAVASHAAQAAEARQTATALAGIGILPR